MCVSWRYPDNTIPAILYVKSNDGKLYPIQPLNDNSAVYSTLYSIFYRKVFFCKVFGNLSGGLSLYKSLCHFDFPL